MTKASDGVSYINESHGAHTWLRVADELVLNLGLRFEKKNVTDKLTDMTPGVLSAVEAPLVRSDLADMWTDMPFY
jgi:hypothetical protein